jgi:hypothetical protein
MSRLFLPALVVCWLGLFPAVAAADASAPSDSCTGDPYLPGVAFHCGEVTVQLGGDSRIATVLHRSAPTATVICPEGSRRWLLSVPRGEEVAVRDSLKADPAVVDASLGYIGYLSGGELPDTAFRCGRAPTANPDTSVRAQRESDAPLALGAVLVLLGSFVAGVRARRAVSANH